jgi:hypothetical protein
MTFADFFPKLVVFAGFSQYCTVQFSMEKTLPGGTLKLRWAGRGARSTPFCVLMNLKRRVRALVD